MPIRPLRDWRGPIDPPERPVGWKSGDKDWRTGISAFELGIRIMLADAAVTLGIAKVQRPCLPGIIGFAVLADTLLLMVVAPCGCRRAVRPSSSRVWVG
jgi:hypothetical protein